MTIPFQAVVEALFHPHEPATSLLYQSNTDPYGLLLPLRSVADPCTLPTYWTLSVPGWWCPDMGALDFYEKGEHSRKLVQWFDGGESECFIKTSPFLVFEVDYLILGKDDKVGADRKQLQKHALYQAFIQSGYPFTVIVDSGGKSLHVYTRLTDDWPTLEAFRQQHFDALQDLAWTVFGHYDAGVTREFGRVRLVRTPGALREDGNEQTIVAVGPKRTLNEVFAWFQSQVRPAVMDALRLRAPTWKHDRLIRRHSLQLEAWRRDLIETPHEEGGRGTGWMHVSKKLAAAGCRRPQWDAINNRYDAPWLWWVSAAVYDVMTKGWFFSPDADRGERLRWWDEAECERLCSEERRRAGYEGESAQLFASMEQVVAEQRQQAEAAGLPPVRDQAAPFPQQPTAPAPQAVQGAAMLGGGEPKEGKGRKDGFDPTPIVNAFFNFIPRKHIFKVAEAWGDHWMLFDGKVWRKVGEDVITQMVHTLLMPSGWLHKDKTEVVKGIAQEAFHPDNWVPNTEAVCFSNGTLYLQQDHGAFHQDQFRFEPSYNPEDKQTYLIPFPYTPGADCPQWKRCLERFLPQEWRRNLLQEAFGYTFLPWQKFQKFFVFIGTGANFKSTTLRILESIWDQSREGVFIDRMGQQFALGQVHDKRIAVDGDADFLANKAFDGPSMANVIKKWTGGDPVQIENKYEQGRTVPFMPKLFIAANGRIRFSDPSGGIWRRLIPIRYEIVIPQHEQVADFHRRIIEDEMAGIIQWALEGMRRIAAQNSFTMSAELKEEVGEYQAEVDPVVQFFNDYFVRDEAAGWTDLQPVYETYKTIFLPEIGVGQHVLMSEFRSRLTLRGVVSDKPGLDQPVAGYATNRIPGPGCTHHGVCFKGWRCVHPHLATMGLRGYYPSAQKASA